MKDNHADNLRWLRTGAGLLICLVFSVLQLSSVPSDGLSTADRYLYDTRISVAPPFDTTKVVIVDIDEESLSTIGRWPWSRRTVADLATRITEEGNAAVLGFDVVFAEPEREDQLADQQFALALSQKPIVLGYYFTSDRGGQTSGMLPAPAFESATLPADITRLVWNGFGANLPMLQTASADAGFFNPVLDPDGVTRSLPLLTEFDGQIYESLALRLLRRYLGNAVLAVEEDQIQLAGDRARISLPLSEGLTALVPYTAAPAPGKPRFTYISAARVLNGNVDWKLFDDKIVLVGTSAPGLGDSRATPVSAAFPGVEVHATLINGALENRMLSRLPEGNLISALGILLIGGLFAFAAPRAGAFGVIIATFTSASALFVWNVVAFVHLGWVLPLAASLLTILLVGLFNLAAGYAIEGRARRAVVDLFSEYVSPDVVEKMARDPLNYHGAISVNSELTVMFADIRGFTRIAENMAPEMLKEYLNEVLTDLTECIYRYNGTVDKYMGDAVMAFWGAPVADPDHAENAVRAAIDMQVAITRLSERFAARGFPPVAIGIGINTGIVRVGDMGSKLRRAYTVIGDSVNLAARLESLTKHYGVPIIVGESTQRACPAMQFNAIDTVVVTGRQGAVQIFSPRSTSQANRLSSNPQESDDDYSVDEISGSDQTDESDAGDERDVRNSRNSPNAPTTFDTRVS
ncbi:MAG: adenylate/guanylate cyclase domain-containing protein [Burkholderiaceae bacterium]